MASDMHTKCCADINKYTKANEKLVAAMLKSYRLVMSKPDTRLVACSDPKELERVKKNFLQKKLGLKSSDAKLEELIASVCEKMKPSRQKQRLTFYYLLTEAARKKSVFL